MSISVLEFKPVSRNTLVGFAVIYIAELRLRIRDISIHEKNGERWVQLPAKAQMDREGNAIRKDGKIQYATLLEWSDAATRVAFAHAVIAALIEHDPNAFKRAA